MKIFCVIGNYRESVESGEEVENKGIGWYLLPDSTLVRSENPMFVPDFADKFVAFPSLVVRIEKIGKNISPKFSNRYYKSVAPGLAVMATDILADLKTKGMPWTRAVVFDRCCMLGEFSELAEGNYSIPELLFKNSDNEIPWEAGRLKRSIDEVISEISRENTLKIGDFILVGLENIGFEMKIGDTISAEADGDVKLNIRLR